MRIAADGQRITAPRALLINEFEWDEPDSCAVLVLSAPVVVARGAKPRVDGHELVVTEADGERRCAGSWEMRLREHRLL